MTNRIRRFLRRAWRSVIAAVERARHAGRRREARAFVAGLPDVRSVLFLCHGNLYRSPFAAACFELAARERNLPITTESAGLSGSGQPAPAEARVIAERYGVDLSEHRSRTVNGVLLSNVDLIAVMDVRQLRLLRTRFGLTSRKLIVLGDLDPHAIHGRAIADPQRRSARTLENSYARVERCVRELIGLLESNRQAFGGPRGGRSASPG